MNKNAKLLRQKGREMRKPTEQEIRDLKEEVAHLKAERDSLQKAHNYNIDKIASLEDALKRAEEGGRI